MATPTVGHLDPEYLRIMDDTRTMLQHVFRTQNELTVAMPGTGSAGMETCVANLIEPGDEMIIGVNGVFGTRMVDVAERCGAMVHPVEAAWGEIIDPSSVARALEEFPETRVVGIVHAETSTGAHQPLEQISETVHRAGALLLSMRSLPSAESSSTSTGGRSMRVTAEPRNVSPARPGSRRSPCRTLRCRRSIPAVSESRAGIST
jgi:aspartate aminotransferase-like enzyme